MKAITFGFVFLLLLALACVNGNSALFDLVPFGGWSFLVLYLAFHFTYLASVSERAKNPSAAGGRFMWGVLFYLAIIVGALPISLYLMGQKRLGWIFVLLSVVGLLIACGLVQNGGEITATLPSGAHRREKWVRAMWTLVFGLVVLSARSFDLLNHDFESAGIRLVVFNLARLLLVIYFGFGLFQIGTWILKLAGGSSSQLAELRGLDRVILCSVFGGATATLGMFILGLLNFYYTWLIFVLFLPIVWTSGQWLAPSTEWILFGTRRFLRHKTFHQAYLSSLLLAALMVGLCLTFVIKGLWPGDAGGDVYSHYLPYYREVIARHGLSPNDLWYHYYESKGGGLFFLGMLLSDELAAQLVTLCFHFIFAAIICDLVTRMTRVRTAGLFAALLVLYIYLPLRIWGIFLKPHDLMGCWLFFGLWLSIFVGRQKILGWRQCVVGGVIFSAALALQFPTAVGLTAPLWGLGGLWYFATRRYPAGLFTWLLSTGSVVSLACLVAFNQWRTGLGLETPIRLFWKFANVQQFGRWVSPYLMLYLDEGSAKGVGEVGSPFAKLTNFGEFAKLMRWEDLGWVLPSIQHLAVLVLVLVAAKAISKKREISKSEIASLPILLVAISWLISLLAKQLPPDKGLLLCLAALVGFAVAQSTYPEEGTSRGGGVSRIISQLSALSRGLGRLLKRQVFADSAFFLICLTVLAWFLAHLVNQPVSIYRMFAFLAAVSITGAVVVWAVALGVVRQGITPNTRSRRGLTVVFLTFAVCLSCSTILAGVRERIRPMIGFALGLESAETALASVPKEYTTHGDVWPPYLAARKLVGLKAPILTFGINGDLLGTSFAFPGAGLQSEVSYSLGPNWHTIAFGSPSMAERELRNLGINYFLVDWRYESLFGGVPMSSLFAPEQLAKRFSMLADYGGVWLLTWRNEGEPGIAADKIIVWDLVRNGCVDPAANPQIVKDFSDRLGRLLAGKSFTPLAISLRAGNSFTPLTISSEDHAFVAMSCSMEEELREVLPHELLDTTFEAVTRNTREIFLRTLWKLHVPDSYAALDDPPDANPGDSISSLSVAILRQVSENIRRQILLQLPPQTDQQAARTFADMNNQAFVTRKARDLYDVVHETYDFNHGATNSIVRKPGLRHVQGWQ